MGYLEDFEEIEDYSEEGNSFEIFNSSVIWGMDWTAETIASQLEKGNIDINPKFQRRDAWTDVDKSRLIESLMLGLPVPSIILAEMKNKKNNFVVIDGKQRLLSIKQFSSKQNAFLKLKLKSMEILTELNGKTLEEISEISKYEKYVTAFENSTIRTIVIKNWPNETFLYSVFLRLNTGSKPLSPQELRQALHPGEFLDYLDDVTAESSQLMTILRNKKADSRMRDIELALRYYAYLYNRKNYNGNLRLFLDNTCLLLNNDWANKEKEIRDGFKELEESIAFCFKIFGSKEAFSKWDNGGFNNRFNRALFEVFTFYFSNKYVREMIDSKEFVKQFIDLCKSDAEFVDSISNTTKDIHKVNKRFATIENIIGELVPRLPKTF